MPMMTLIIAHTVPVQGMRVWPSLTNPANCSVLLLHIVNELENLSRHMVAT